MITLVIDTNILISALIKDSIIRKILTSINFNFLFPDFGISEIYVNKEEILSKSKISEREFDILLLRLLKNIKLIPINMIFNFRNEADKVMGHIDKNDSVFIATALAFNCPIWSDDKHFKRQNSVRILTTKEILNLI